MRAGPLVSTVRIRQYAHFDVGSEVITPEQVTGALLLEPTKISRRGSRSTDPMIPRINLWRYRALGQGCVDELIRELVDLFEPRRDQLVTLTTDESSWYGISIMRSLDDPTALRRIVVRQTCPRTSYGSMDNTNCSVSIWTSSCWRASWLSAALSTSLSTAERPEPPIGLGCWTELFGQRRHLAYCGALGGGGYQKRSQLVTGRKSPSS